VRNIILQLNLCSRLARSEKKKLEREGAIQGRVDTLEAVLFADKKLD
jgi:hypothetical protein